MEILVTGAAGFLGAALANQLVAAGHAVRGVDDLSAGDPHRLSPAVLLTRGDVNDRPKLWTLLQGVECVYHLAARVAVPESVLYPSAYNAVNVGGTLSVLEAMRDAGVRRLIFVSSGAVYGEQATQPVHEQLLPDPRSPYAVSKLAAENYLRTLGALWGIEVVILRVFNAYGPGQPLPVAHAPVIPRFVRQALTGGSLVVHGDGVQTRDFVYLDDVVAALVAAAGLTGHDRPIINIGSGTAVSVRELLGLITQLTGRKLDLLYSSTEAGGVSRLCADVSRAAAWLGWQPQVPLAEGLRRVLQLDVRFQVAVEAQEGA